MHTIVNAQQSTLPKAIQLLYVSDGKAGHRAQALGLFKALQAQQPQAQLHEIALFDLPIASLLLQMLLSRFFYRQSHLTVLQGLAPDWIVGVGSHTHFRVFLLKCCYPNAKSIILMKPNLPLRCVDAAVIPVHDAVPEQAKVLCTQGVLNPLHNEQRHQAGRILIAVGGDSKRHQLQSAAVIQQIKQIVQNHLQSQIILTTSRRTPLDFVNQLQAQIGAARLAIYPVEQTPQGWIFEQMQLAEAFWVTEDSVSMLYEGLTAGCRVGVIAVTRLKQDRITQAVDALLVQGTIANTTQLAQLPQPVALNEAARVARWLLNKLIMVAE